MAVFRIQVEHARYWRGVPHRWSTTYHMYQAAVRAPIDNAACDAFQAAEAPLLFHGPNNENGISSISIYGASGGIPIASRTYFDWKTVASWVAPSGSAWTSSETQALATTEVCYIVNAPIGTSRSGKPVVLTKYYHACPANNGGAAADITTAQRALLVTAFNTCVGSLGSTYGLVYSSPSGGIPGTPTVQPYYRNHQMPRGRKRKALVTADGKYQGVRVSVPQFVAD